MLKRKTMVALLLLSAVLSGCVQDTPPKQEQEQQEELPENNVTEEEIVKNAYRESLAAGQQVCPDFPEVERLAHLDEQILLDGIGPAVVRVENQELFGSGVIWKPEDAALWIVTCRHLLEEENPDTGQVSRNLQPEIIFWDGIRTFAEDVVLSETYDLAFLRVDLETMGYYTVERYLGVRWDEDSFENLKPGDDIFLLGSADYPAGNLAYGTIGNCSIYMEGFDTEMLWAYCEVKPGMSGSGVFDERGNLIGIVCAGNEQKEAAVLPLNKILKEWGDRGY